MYGAWITPQGEVIDVLSVCDHISFCDYYQAHDEGWIAVIYEGSMFSISLRLNPRKTPKAALSTAIKLIKELDSPLDVNITDIFTNDFEDCAFGVSQRKVRQLLGGVRRGKSELKSTRCGRY